MVKTILYDPKEQIISYGDKLFETFDCGSEMDTAQGIDAIIPLLVKLRVGEYNLQQAYDKYLRLKSKGIL